MDKFLFLFVIALCGTRAISLRAEGANRIIEATPANVNQFPYMVSLQDTSQIQHYTRGHRCGGALVTLQHAVTAASCNFFVVNGVSMPINPAQFRVFSGAVSLTSADSASRSVDRIVPHPRYFTSTPFVNNIAVIFLTSAFSLTTSITPVPLPITDAGLTHLTPCYVSGWGAQNATATASVQLMHIPQSVPDQDVCRAYYYDRINIEDSMICSWGVQHKPFSGCTGDLGNPLVCSGYLNGILIRYNECTVSMNPELYTRISSFSAWINSTIAPTAPTAPGAASTFKPGMAVLAVIAIAQIIIVSVIN